MRSTVSVLARVLARALVVPSLAAVCVTVPSVASVAHAQSKDPASVSNVDAARRHFKRGVELFTERNFSAALVEFQRANQRQPNWRIHFNIAQTQVELGEYADAIRSFQTYLSLGGGEVEDARRSEVDHQVQRLSGYVGRVTVKTSVPGAEVWIDDRMLGTSPIQEALLVSPGHRKLEARKRGYATASRFLDVAGGDQTEVALTLVEDARPQSTVVVSPSPTGPSSEEGARGGNTTVWIGVAATGLLAAGAATTGVLALLAHDDYKKQLDAFPGSASAVDDARSKMNTLALVTDVLGAATVVAGGVTLYLALSRGSSASRPHQTGSVELIVRPRGASLGWQF
jgi:hypothetical protein